MFTSLPTITVPPPLTANQIQAAYVHMRNNGQNAVGEIGKGYISIEEWRDRELKRIGV